MVKLILVRHGYSITNRDKKFTGQTDVPLDETGLEQGKAASQYIYENYSVNKIYSSDLCRAVDTIKPLADKLGLPVETNSDLREIYMGKWEGMYIEDVQTKDAESYEAYKANPMVNRAGGGENYGDLMKRSAEVIRQIVSENDGKTVVVATHGGFIKSLLRQWNNDNPEGMSSVPIVPNASITVVNYDKGTYSLEITGYDDYLNKKTGAKPGSMVH